MSDAYWNNYTPFDLRYCNWNRDLYTGFLPNQQFGNVSVVDMTVSSDEIMAAPITFGASGNQVAVTKAAIVSSTSSTGVGTVSTPPGGTIPVGTSLYAQVQQRDLTGAFSILALRQAEFLQKWKEIALSGDQDYRSQIENILE